MASVLEKTKKTRCRVFLEVMITSTKINENKSAHVTFTLRKQTCPQVTINNITIPNKDSVRYHLGMTLDRRLTFKQHIIGKSKQLKTKLKKLYWLIRQRSNLSTQSKITLYKTVIKPVWTYEPN